MKASDGSRMRQVSRISILDAGFEEIESAGNIKLQHELRIEIEDVLNSYVLRSGWDRNSRPSEEKKAHLRSLSTIVRGLLESLGDVNLKFNGDIDFHPAIALDLQSLFHRAGINPVQFFGQLVSVEKVLEQNELERDKGGRPKDLFLPQFFCELEEVYIKAGGGRTGVTKTLDGTRESPFADFVNAILRFAPAGVGPSSSPAVAVAWERQLRSRRTTNLHSSPDASCNPAVTMPARKGGPSRKPLRS